MALATGRAPDREARRELGDAVHRHVAVVERMPEPCRDLDRGVQLQPRADVRADTAALQERRRLDRTATDEDVLGPDQHVFDVPVERAPAPSTHDVVAAAYEAEDAAVRDHPRARVERTRDHGAGHRLLPRATAVLV